MKDDRACFNDGYKTTDSEVRSDNKLLDHSENYTVYCIKKHVSDESIPERILLNMARRAAVHKNNQ